MTMLSPDEVATRKRADENEARLVAHYAAKIKKTHGPPPLTITESPEDFERILSAVIRIRCPEDDLLQLDAWDIAVAILLDKRYNRASTGILNRKICENLDFQEKRAQEKSKQANARSETHGDPQDANRSPTDKRKEQLQHVIEETPREVGQRLDQATLEVANSRGFEQALPGLTAIDDLKTRNFFRRNVSVQSLRERRPAYIPPLSHIQHKLDSQRQEEDRRAWLKELDAQEQAEKEAQAAKPASSQDLPTVSAPKLGNHDI
jgi:hypothetical protein